MPEVPGRLARQLAFINEIDRLKGVLRQSAVLDGSRRENSAEHSWHLALMALILAEHAAGPVDVARVVEMVLVHDLVEIDAGDTFAYDEQGAREQPGRERAAADRIFALLPAEQARALRALWEEFEARQTAEARFAAAVDRLQPLMQNCRTGGASWQRHGITADRVAARARAIAEGAPALGAYARRLIDAAVADGILRPQPPRSEA